MRVRLGGADPREVDLPGAAADALRAQRELFVAKFGREPGPDDPVFFNPAADQPEPMTDEQVAELDQLWERLGLESLRANAEAVLEEHGMIRRAGPKPGRNQPCPCGSGRKYKACCG